MPGLAEAGWTWVQSVGWLLRSDSRKKRNQSPDARVWIFGLDLGDIVTIDVPIV